ncbi:MAG: outer membrane beta-barrel domain-containing protein [Myxococcales bacterium]
MRARARARGCLAAAVLVGSAWALAASAAADEEVEDYGQVAAIQNREYRMGQELELGVAVLPNDAFYKGVAPELAYTFHFNDDWGLEVRGAYSVDFNTNLESQLQQIQVGSTFSQETRGFLTGDVVWSPIYIKGTLTNTSVVHGELFFDIGGGAFEEVPVGGTGAGNFYAAPNLGAGLRFFLSKVFSLRLDVRDHLLLDKNLDDVLEASLGISVNFFAPE